MQDLFLHSHKPCIIPRLYQSARTCSFWSGEFILLCLQVKNFLMLPGAKGQEALDVPHDLEVGCMVEVPMTESLPRYGVIRWIGHIPQVRDKLVAGLELVRRIVSKCLSHIPLGGLHVGSGCLFYLLLAFLLMARVFKATKILIYSGLTVVRFLSLVPLHGIFEKIFEGSMKMFFLLIFNIMYLPGFLKTGPLKSCFLDSVVQKVPKLAR